MQQLAAWYQTKRGRFAVAVVMLAAAFGLLNLAINSGSLLQYTLVIVLTVAGAQTIVQLIATIIHEHKTAKA